MQALSPGLGRAHAVKPAEVPAAEPDLPSKPAASETPLRAASGLRMDTSKPFRRIAGIVDSVTEAHFTFDQDEADRIRSLQAA